jgi:hypothetical protein
LSQDFHFRLTHTNQQNYPNFLALLNFIAGQSEIEEAGQFFMEYNTLSPQPPIARETSSTGQTAGLMFSMAKRHVIRNPQ